MKTKSRQRPKSPRKRKAVVREFFAAVDRLIAASRQAEQARDKLLQELQQAEAKR